MALCFLLIREEGKTPTCDPSKKPKITLAVITLARLLLIIFFLPGIFSVALRLPEVHVQPPDLEQATNIYFLNTFLWCKKDIRKPGWRIRDEVFGCIFMTFLYCCSSKALTVAFMTPTLFIHGRYINNKKHVLSNQFWCFETPFQGETEDFGKNIEKILCSFPCGFYYGFPILMINVPSNF